MALARGSTETRANTATNTLFRKCRALRRLQIRQQTHGLLRLHIDKMLNFSNLAAHRWSISHNDFLVHLTKTNATGCIPLILRAAN
jgi:hypothetical protein